MSFGLGMGLWLGHNPAVSGGGGGGTTTTWSAATSTPNVTLSGGNLIATFASPGGLARANNSHTTGTQSFTIVTPSHSSGGSQIGFANASAATTDFCGETNNSIGLNFADGRIYKNGAIVGADTGFANWGSADIIKPILKNSKAYWQKNGVDAAGMNSTAETGGIDVSAMGALFPAIATGGVWEFDAVFTSWP